jgi:aminoglycoside 6'-N-acetyltransferase I
MVHRRHLAMHIRDLSPRDSDAIQQTAAFLVEAFREHHPHAWPDTKSALEEVKESFGQGRISRVAVDEEDKVLGWIGGIPQYQGHVFELHPLAVHPGHQRKGIGTALVADLEEQVRERGGITISLGTDDENNQTTLSAIDLYPDPLSHLAQIRNLRAHPYEFYQKVGFVIAGIMPDANGWGKPDIFMARRVGGGRALPGYGGR